MVTYSETIDTFYRVMMILDKTERDAAFVELLKKTPPDVISSCISSGSEKDKPKFRDELIKSKLAMKYLVESGFDGKVYPSASSDCSGMDGFIMAYISAGGSLKQAENLLKHSGNHWSVATNNNYCFHQFIHALSYHKNEMYDGDFMVDISDQYLHNKLSPQNNLPEMIAYMYAKLHHTHDKVKELEKQIEQLKTAPESHEAKPATPTPNLQLPFVSSPPAYKPIDTEAISTGLDGDDAVVFLAVYRLREYPDPPPVLRAVIDMLPQGTECIPVARQMKAVIQAALK